MRHPRHPTAGEQPHALARPEALVGILRDRAQFAVVELDRDLQPLLLGRALLDRAAGYAAGDRTKDRTDSTALAAADVAACHATYYAAGYRADAALGALDAHLAHAFNHAHAHRLLLPRLTAGIDAARTGAGTAGNEQRSRDRAGKRRSAQNCHSLSFYPSCA